MARQINEVLEVERENDRYVDTLSLLKEELKRIRKEYLTDAPGLTKKAVDEIDEDLETLLNAIETAILGI
jgi:hypothetical protein